MLCWPPAILFYRYSSDLLSFFFFSRLISEFALADRHRALPHKIYKIRSEIWVAPSPFPPKFGSPKTSKFRRDFAQLRHLMASISGTQQEIVNRKKTALQTTDTPAQANLIRCTLVHKRRKIGPEF